jgi:DNA polymerase
VAETSAAEPLTRDVARTRATPEAPTAKPKKPAPEPNGGEAAISEARGVPDGIEALRADKARRLDELRAEYERKAPHKAFVTAHTKIVWGNGDPHARLCFVGEAPGEEEDRQGVPFVGKSGELLNKSFAALGLRREDVYICNVLKTRPPDNAKPTSREVEACLPYLLRQLDVVQPKVVVLLGSSALTALLGSQESITRARGSWKELGLPSGARVAVLPTFHPAYVLRNYTPEVRGMVWSDLKKAAERVGIVPPSR